MQCDLWGRYYAVGHNKRAYAEETNRLAALNEDGGVSTSNMTGNWKFTGEGFTEKTAFACLGLLTLFLKREPLVT